MSHTLQKLLNEFLEDLEIAQGRSLKTIENYDHYLRRFFEAEKIKDVEDITAEAIRRFRRQLAPDTSQGLSLATVNYHLIAVRQFLKYLARRDIEALDAEKVGLAKVAERDIDVLYPEEVDALLAAPRGTSVESLRDRAILHTLVSTGMRVSELISLDRDDIRPTSNEIPIRGKGNKVRVVFLSGAAQGAIGTYLKERHDMDPALFIRHKKGTAGAAGNLRLTVRTIQRLMKKYAATAGLTKRITPHTLRHSFATDLLTNGADIRQVQQLLGHASITTTQIYTHLTDTHLREVHEKFHRRSKSLLPN